MINTWEEFKGELKKQFYPKDVVYEAKRKLTTLKHKTTISNYIREFCTLMLRVPDMRDEDLLFVFMEGLPNWAKIKLKRQKVYTMSEAMSVAQSLTEFQMEKGDSHAGKKISADRSQILWKNKKIAIMTPVR